jgi:hypothetical protein
VGRDGRERPVSTGDVLAGQSAAGELGQRETRLQTSLPNRAGTQPDAWQASLSADRQLPILHNVGSLVLIGFNS